MKLRNFTKTDWMGFSGAEAPSSSQPPMIADGELSRGGGYIIVISKDLTEILIFPTSEAVEEGNHLSYIKNIPFRLGKRLIESWEDLPDQELLEIMGFEEV